MTNTNQITTTLLSLLDAAKAVIQLPADVRSQSIGVKTIHYLLEDAKALDRLISAAIIHPIPPITPPVVEPTDSPIITAPKPKRTLVRPAKRPAPTGIIYETPSTGHPFIPSDPVAELAEAVAATIIHPIAPITPIPPSTVVSPTVPPDETDEKKVAKRLSFAELDPLVRKEMKRLSMDGRMPNTRLWDTERDPRLPTMTGLYYRYSVGNMLDLATMMGLEPPLTYKNTNGAHPITA